MNALCKSMHRLSHSVIVSVSGYWQRQRNVPCLILSLCLSRCLILSMCLSRCLILSLCLSRCLILSLCLVVSSRHCVCLVVSFRHCVCLVVSSHHCVCLVVSSHHCVCLVVSSLHCVCLVVSSLHCVCLRSLATNRNKRAVQVCALVVSLRYHRHRHRLWRHRSGQVGATPVCTPNPRNVHFEINNNTLPHPHSPPPPPLLHLLPSHHTLP